MFSFYLYLYLHRSSRSQIFFRIVVLKNFAYFTGKHLRWSEACSFIKKGIQHGCFPVKFAKFLTSPFLQNTSGACFCLHFLIYTYLRILIYTYLARFEFSLYLLVYEPDKIDKVWDVETKTKFSRLKSISSIEDTILI